MTGAALGIKKSYAYGFHVSLIIVACLVFLQGFEKIIPTFF